MKDDKSYDQHQIDAPLMTCLKCGKQYYSTAARTICLACQPWVFGTFINTEQRTDVNGNEITGP